MFLLCIFLFLYSCRLVFFGGRIHHPSLVLLFSINISLCRFLSKKIYIYIYISKVPNRVPESIHCVHKCAKRPNKVRRDTKDNSPSLFKTQPNNEVHHGH